MGCWMDARRVSGICYATQRKCLPLLPLVVGSCLRTEVGYPDQCGTGITASGPFANRLGNAAGGIVTRASELAVLAVPVSGPRVCSCPCAAYTMHWPPGLGKGVSGQGNCGDEKSRAIIKGSDFAGKAQRMTPFVAGGMFSSIVSAGVWCKRPAQYVVIFEDLPWRR
jgi:hypothetical protein